MFPEERETKAEAETKREKTTKIEQRERERETEDKDKDKDSHYSPLPQQKRSADIEFLKYSLRPGFDRCTFRV